MIGLLLGGLQKRSFNGNSRFIYFESSLRLHHLNYFNHVLELFKPYLSKDFNPKESSFTDKRSNKKIVQLNLLHYHFHVLIIIETYSIFQIIWKSQIY